MGSHLTNETTQNTRDETCASEAITGAASSQVACREARRIRVLTVMEATVVTGPAKALLEFAAFATHARGGLPPVESMAITFVRGDTGSDNVFIDSARRSGLRVDVVHERFPFDPAILPHLRRLVKELEPDIIQSMNFKSHFLVRLLGLHKQAHWIALHHGYTWTDLKNRAYNQLDRWSLPAAEHVVTVCRPFASELERIGVPAGRISVQHNTAKPFVPAAPGQVEQIRRSLGVPSDALIVLSVGRLSREKGHLDLIEAVGKLDLGKRPFRLVIVGDGPERGLIQKHAKKLGVDSIVVLAGQQNDVTPYYTMADLLVLPSHSEGSPLVLLEAMAAGLPIVATNVGGVPEISVHGETALLVDRGRPAALADAMGRLLEDEQLRKQFGETARTIALKYFSLESYCENIVKLYCQLLQQTSSVGRQS